MRFLTLLAGALISSPILGAVAAPVGPTGPCADDKVDLILRGDMDPSECCSYGKCKGDVVISVGD